VLSIMLPSLKGTSPSSVLQSVDFPEPTGPITIVREDFKIRVFTSRRTNLSASQPHLPFSITIEYAESGPRYDEDPVSAWAFSVFRSKSGRTWRKSW